MRSKEVLSYHKIYDVTVECREIDFVAENTPGYEKEWIRYGYFQWSNQEHIKPYQRVIVMKKARYYNYYANMHANISTTLPYRIVH